MLKWSQSGPPCLLVLLKVDGVFLSIGQVYLYQSSASGKDIGSLISNVGSGVAATAGGGGAADADAGEAKEEKKEEKKEESEDESDDDMGFGEWSHTTCYMRCNQWFQFPCRSL